MVDPAEATTNQMDLPSPPRGSKPARDGGSAFLCSLCDLDQPRSVAYVDSTTGDLFRSPASVTVDVRNDMVEFLRRMSESYVTDSVLHAQEGAGTYGRTRHLDAVAAKTAPA
ncbi:hypothetical protein Taro_045007 [Colocasia esculenta]|uniref:Uncharacterized protein n=1 Tax=Colocasia esculenta TaxID=4460 RepID=A0A843WKT6_COLES|nr:hypothetical protein [Colocasia esculenta]